MTDWFVGQRVVCVSSRWRIRKGLDRAICFFSRLPLPAEREIYGIASIHISRVDGREYLGLRGFDPRQIFDSAGFRPLVEHKNDIGVFRRLLENLDLPVDAC